MRNHLTVPHFSDIQTAAKRISGKAHITPVLTSQSVNERVGCRIFFKCENFQKIGAFKFRGACNAVFSLSDEEAAQGVATHSSGNHAQAIALSARLRGIKSFVVMPSNAPKVKVEAVKNYGATVYMCKPTLESREQTLADVVREHKATPIHPYNNNRVISGQGTAAMELLHQQPNLDIVLTPVGGGGLLSGTAISVSSIKPQASVIGCEPEMANDAWKSFKSGVLTSAYGTNTIADGLRTSLGDLPFSIIKEKVADIVTVSESSIIEAMRFIWERMNIIIEPSGAVPLAAVLEKKIDCSGKNAGIILTGGNVDLDNLPWQHLPDSKLFERETV